MFYFIPTETPSKTDLARLAYLIDAQIMIPASGPQTVTVQVGHLPVRTIRGVRAAYEYLSYATLHGAEYWTNVDRAAREALDRRERRSHPPGCWDKAGRFYSSESCDCCAGIRTPSRAFPYSEMTHARTALHVANVFEVELAHMKTRMREIEAAAAPLPARRRIAA